jgi:hypothetical protein
MKNYSTNTNTLPLALFLGKKQSFETPAEEKFVYNPLLQTTIVYHMGETGTGGKIGTKSLKTSATGTGGKAGTSRQDFKNDQKNEIDDSKYKDK